ncbi:Wzz/FepE/Etk N-terminal domain-containing protein, partial [Flavobacteriaceae bacterium]|nr:Wzz/FepE/Etk N-terminal domain-containing protein [Flavobacteriaceae bacterium]
MTENNNLYDEDQIDIITLFKKVWLGKRLIIKVTALFFVIGCIVALLSPVVYTAQTTFVPQVSEDKMSTSKGSLGSLASLAGINLNQGASSSDSYLSPMLYSKLAQSEEFSLKIIDEEIINPRGNKLTIKEYLLSGKSSFNFNPIKFIKKYTIKLFLNNESKENNRDLFKGFNFLSEEDFYL